MAPSPAGKRAPAGGRGPRPTSEYGNLWERGKAEKRRRGPSGNHHKREEADADADFARSRLHACLVVIMVSGLLLVPSNYASSSYLSHSRVRMMRSGSHSRIKAPLRGQSRLIPAPSCCQYSGRTVHRLRGGNDEAEAILEKAFQESLLNPDADARRAAEDTIFAMENKQGYLHALLSILAKHKDEPTHIAMQAASIRFKNIIRHHWTEEDDPGAGNEFIITDAEKREVKEIILQAMCEVPLVPQRQLTESVRLIARHEFPRQWPEFLPELTEKLKANMALGNLGAVIGLLESASVVLQRHFKGKSQSKELVEDLKFCLDTFQEPLLRVFTALISQVIGETAVHANSPLPSPTIKLQSNADRGRVFLALKYMSNIFMSLQTFIVPAYFEDHIAEWMHMFHAILELPTSAEEKEALALQAQTVEALTLYAKCYEEEFQGHLAKQTRAVWSLAVSKGPDTRFDELVTQTVTYLTTVAGQPWNRGLFEAEGAVQGIIERICVPNLAMRQIDLDAFEERPDDYIRDNIEGSEISTRTSGATSLIRRLLVHFEAPVTQLCLTHCQRLLDEYKRDNSAWQSKYTALSLFMAVSVKGQMRHHGATTLNAGVPVERILNDHVFASLVDGGPEHQPQLKALMIKTLTTFRVHLPVATCVTLFPSLITLVRSRNYVVHTYAALAIDRLVTMTPVSDRKKNILDAEAVGSVFREALGPLMDLAESREYIKNRWPYNDRAMKTITDLLARSPPAVVSPSLGSLLLRLNKLIVRINDYPLACHSGQFIRYIFENVALIVRRRVAEQGGDAAAELRVVGETEAVLFPVFQEILNKQQEDLMAYVLQIMALLLEAAPGEISQTYIMLFNAVLAPTNWDMAGNVPGLVRLLQAYLRKGTSQLLAMDSNLVLRIVNVAETLAGSRRTEQSGIKLFIGLAEALDLQLLRPHLPVILRLSLKRLKASWPRPPVRRFALPIMDLLSVLVGKHGVGVLKEGLRDTSLLHAIQKGFWADTLPKIQSSGRRKAGIIATTRMLVEDESIWADAELVGKMVKNLVETLLSRSAETMEKEDHLSVLEDIGDGGVSGTRLTYSREGPLDPFAEVGDLEMFVMQSLARVSQSHPGVLLGILQKELPENRFTAFQNIALKGNVQIA